MVVPQGKVAPATIKAMRPLLPRGGSLGAVSPQFGAFRVEIASGPGAAAFTLYRGRDPIAMSCVAWTNDGQIRAWKESEALYFQLSEQLPISMGGGEAPDMPTTLPWLVSLILPGAHAQPDGVMDWVADFEQCLAATLIDAEVA